MNHCEKGVSVGSSKDRPTLTASGCVERIGWAVSGRRTWTRSVSVGTKQGFGMRENSYLFQI